MFEYWMIRDKNRDKIKDFNKDRIVRDIKR